MRGEIYCKFKNEFVNDFSFYIENLITVPFGYPSEPLELKMLDYSGILHKEKLKLEEKLDEKCRQLGEMMEPGLMELMHYTVRQVEGIEYEMVRLRKRKNLFELRMEDLEKKSKISFEKNTKKSLNRKFFSLKPIIGRSFSLEAYTKFGFKNHLFNF